MTIIIATMPPKKYYKSKSFWTLFGSGIIPEKGVTLLSIDPGFKDLPVYYGRRTEKYIRTYDHRLFSFRNDACLFASLTRVLSEHFQRCYEHDPFDIALIEQQLEVSRLPKIVSYVLFGILMRDYPTVSVYFLNSKMKTAFPLANEPADVKLRSIVRAEKWCRRYNDKLSLKLIKDAPKTRKDDYADTITQAQAFFEKLGRFVRPAYYDHDYFLLE